MDKHLIIDDFPLQTKPNIGCKLEDFEILQTLGKGGYGFVAKVKSKVDHKLYAMKMIDFSLIKEKTEIELSLNEINIIQSLNSPHIIKYYACFREQNRLYIIMEFMNNGDIKGYINAHQNMNKPIPEDELWELFYQCASGLCYIHKKGLIHRDIKPANLFMTDDKAIKIGDFGVSATKNKQNINSNMMNSKETLMIGTPSFMAPEMFNMGGYGNKVDVYALGVSFNIMCFYEPPRLIVFGPMGNTWDLKDIPPKFNRNCYSQEVSNLIRMMLEKDPKIRPSSSEVLDYIKTVYNKKNRQNDSIDCVYRCLYSFTNLTNYMKQNMNFIKQILAERPISNSFLYAVEKMDQNNWSTELNFLREILTYENSCFPDPGLIDPYDLMKFILQRFHKESIINKSIDPNNPYILTPDNNPLILQQQQVLNSYLMALQNYKSCISDWFFGTYQITKFCSVCKQNKYYFQNFFYIPFNIDEALKRGLSGMNGYILNYFKMQNQLIINNSSFCFICKTITNHQENKKFFSFPYNLIICFKGEKEKYDNQYLKLQLQLDLSSLGLQGGSPNRYNLKGIINRYISNGKKYYSCVYYEHFQQKWFLSDGYNKQITEPSAFLNNNIDVVMLFYNSLN